MAHTVCVEKSVFSESWGHSTPFCINEKIKNFEENLIKLSFKVLISG